MQVISSFVSSINGKITNGIDPDVRKWSSKEDQMHFQKLSSDADLIIRTSTTFEVAKDKIAKSNKKNIVLTRNPKKFANKMPHVKFTSDSPEDIINKLKKEGVNNVLLSAGSTVATIFLFKNLINIFYLTIEPVVFGTGVDLIAKGETKLDFTLLAVKKLNAAGTILLTYKPSNK